MADELLTILFTDVEGSTTLYSAKGDSAARAILETIDELGRQQVRAHDGRTIKSLGDGLMAVFASPRRAVACALALQKAVANHAGRHPDQAVRVRAGLHTGEVSETGGDLTGEAVAAAARICAKARGGEVVGSEVIRQLCGSLADTAFEPRGRFALKGFPERWRLYRIVPADAARSTPVPLGEATPFVGRESERAELRRLLDRAVAGHGGLVMIGGEPGVGKSRLCEELAVEARQRFRVFVGHCYESGRDVPYMPWVELVETTMRETAPEALRDALGDDAPELARLVPQLRRLFPDLPPPVDVPPEQQRRYAFNSFRECVTRLCHVQPRFYVLEDLHWADEGTLLLLEHLAERLSSIPCLIVGTYRDPPIDVSPQLAETLSSLVRRRQVRLLSLRRHSEVEVEALLRALSGQAPPHAVRAAIYGETEGNAFFVEEVFRHFAESGRLLDERGCFRQDISIGELDVPANVRLVTGRRLERLSETTRRTLSITAVAGRRVGSPLLEAVADVHGDELIDAVDEAERARLIVTNSVGEHEEHWFAHELIRQTLLTGLPAARRRQYHLRVAEAMERVFSDDLPAQAGTIAEHLVEAGAGADKARLFHYLVVAGRRALESAAFEDALRHLRRAATLAEHATQVERAEMLFQLGMAERSVGRWSEAVPPWRQAIEIFEDLGDVEAVGRTCLTAGFNLAWAGRVEESYGLAQRGLTALSGRRTSDRARLLAFSGFLVGAGGDYAEAMTMIDDGLSLAADLEDTDALGFGLLWKAILRVCFMEWRTAAEDCRQVESVFLRSGELWHLATARGFLLESLVGLGEFEAARQLHAELMPLVERLGNVGAMWHCVMAAGQLGFCETGDLPGLDKAARGEIELCEQAGLGWASWGWAWLAEVELLLGNFDTAIAHSEQAQALAAPSPFRGLEWPPQLEALAAAGRREEALALLEVARPQLPRLGEPAGLGRWLMLLSAVEALVMLGERDEAATLYPLVRYCGERTGTVPAYPVDAKVVERIAGMAAAAGREWTQAEQHFATAIEQAESLPHRPEEAHTRRWYGQMLLERDGPRDRDRARSLLEQAVAGYHGMGMPRHEAMTRELLAGIDAGRVHG